MSRISSGRIYPSFKSFACEAFLISSRKSQSSEAISGEEQVREILFSDIRTCISHISLSSFSFAVSLTIFDIRADISIMSFHFFRICEMRGRLFFIECYISITNSPFTFHGFFKKYSSTSEILPLTYSSNFLVSSRPTTISCCSQKYVFKSQSVRTIRCTLSYITTVSE